MITQLSPLLSRVATQVRPEDLLLGKGAWVYFSPEWPSTYEWAKGRLFEVAEEPVVVPYPLSYILPASDYKDVDLSNSTAGEKVYPEERGYLYQIAVGMKPGEYITHLYVPKDKYVYALGESSMYPEVTDATKKYLGAKKPEDSPAHAPLLFLYVIKDSPAFYLRPYVLESVTFEKCTFELQINKCKLSQILQPTADQVARATRIAWYTELTGY